MPIEVWKFGFGGPKLTANYLLVTLRQGGQPLAKFTRFSLGGAVMAVGMDFAADLLGGTIQTCKYSGTIAAEQRFWKEYSFYVNYSAFFQQEVISTHCRICGHTNTELGKFQTTPHPVREYISAPERRWARIDEVNFDGDYFVGGLVRPTNPARLIFCRFDTGLLLRLPSWVGKRFPTATLCHLTHTHAILEADPRETS